MVQQGQSVEGKRQREADGVNMDQLMREGTDIHAKKGTFYPKAKRELLKGSEWRSGAMGFAFPKAHSSDTVQYDCRQSNQSTCCYCKPGTGGGRRNRAKQTTERPLRKQTMWIAE